jgi:hypothetical protein
LVLALRQIVPVDYAYGFASNDLAGTRIDWQGGKPWPSVLSDSLSAAGLRADISDKAVLISKMAGYAPITPAPRDSLLGTTFLFPFLLLPLKQANPNPHNLQIRQQPNLPQKWRRSLLL